MGIRERVAAMIGANPYSPKAGYGPELSDKVVDRLRRMFGGNLASQPTTQIRWYLSDLELAAHHADAGDIQLAAQLWAAMRRDGVIGGLMGTLTGGLLALPKKWYGEFGVADLRAANGTRSVFDDMCPPEELSQFAADGRVLGIAVGELLPVEGRDFPKFVRLEPEFLRYRWIENRWYYQSLAGMLPITPGEGRWVLHIPGGAVRPWMHALWPALGRSFINKEHALLHRSNYSAKLANPARVAEMPQGRTEDQSQGFLQQLMAWGVNTVFELPPGYQAKLLETNGRGYEVFEAEIETSDKEISISISGQVVTVDGGVGFQNSDVFRAIRLDIIKEVADTLAHTINTQILPHYVANKFGLGAVDRGAQLAWPIERPKDLAAEADAMTKIAAAIKAMREALPPGVELDVPALCERYALPIVGATNSDGQTDPDDDVIETTGEEVIDDEPANDQSAQENVLQ
jgi:hypothetical protein